MLKVDFADSHGAAIPGHSPSLSASQITSLRLTFSSPAFAMQGLFDGFFAPAVWAMQPYATKGVPGSWILQRFQRVVAIGHDRSFAVAAQFAPNQSLALGCVGNNLQVVSIKLVDDQTTANRYAVQRPRVYQHV
jgi:hypothetical protein